MLRWVLWPAAASLLILGAQTATTPPPPAGKKFVPAPVAQPLPYSHKTHIAAGLQCKNCHEMPEPGDFAGVLLSTVEVLNERNHVLVDGVGRGSIESAGITASLEGWIVHCPSDLSLIDQGTFWCLDPARAQCYSDSHRLTLVRR